LDRSVTRNLGLLDRSTLAALYLMTCFAIAGFAVFGVHPERLSWSPQVAAVYGGAFPFFARGHVLLAFGVLALHLVRRVRWSVWLPAFIALYVASLTSELLGTTFGVPFGPYRYTRALGPQWFGHVPLLIPLSWFYMAVPSFALARRARGGALGTIGTVLFGSLVLLVWDLSLDPAMSHATKYWIWGSEGPYYGMPLLNLAGWYVTGLVLMALLAVMRAERWIDRLDARWIAMFYVANSLLPIGLSAAAGLWGAVVLSAIATLMCVAVARAEPLRDAAAARPREEARAA
jgi:uncharacterized membrane protein